MAKQFNGSMLTVEFTMHDGDSYTAYDDILERSGSSLIGGVQFINDGKNALDAYKAGKVIKVPDGDTIYYLNPKEVISVDVIENRESVPTPWEDDFCQPVCDCNGGGGADTKHGVKSVSISPSPQLTPTLESVFPIYWEDLTEEQKAKHEVELSLDVDDVPAGSYKLTVTPTSNSQVGVMGWGAQQVIGKEGETITTGSVTTIPNQFIIGVWYNGEDLFRIKLTINSK